MRPSNPVLRLFTLFVFLFIVGGTALTNAQTKENNFNFGPVKFVAKVTRPGATPSDLPVVQVPSLIRGDKLSVDLDAPALDPTNSGRPWRFIVVFMPHTGPPNKDRSFFDVGTAGGAPIEVPYPSVPIFFFIPDNSKRGFDRLRNDVAGPHSRLFREMADKIAALTTQRSFFDKFVEGLGTVPTGEAPQTYEQRLSSIAKSFNVTLPADCLGADKQNIQKLQCVTSSLRQANLNIPTGVTLGVTTREQLQGLKVRGVAISPYVELAVDLYLLVKKLFPERQFEYIPTLFKESETSLYYNEDPVVTGNMRSVLVYSPNKDADRFPPNVIVEAPKAGLCLRKDRAALMIGPAPANQPDIFSTYGRDWQLLITQGTSTPFAIPLEPNPKDRSFIIKSAGVEFPPSTGAQATGQIRGKYGFGDIALQSVNVTTGVDVNWKPTNTEMQQFVVGAKRKVSLNGPWGACVERVAYLQNDLPVVEAELDRTTPNTISASFDLTNIPPGPGKFAIYQYGSENPVVTAQSQAYSILPEVKTVAIHEGDSHAILQGDRLQQVMIVTINNVEYRPTDDSGDGVTTISVKSDSDTRLTSGTTMIVDIKLADGRSLPRISGYKVRARRPALQPIVTPTPVPPLPGTVEVIQLPVGTRSQDSEIRLSLKARSPYVFSDNFTVQVKNARRDDATPHVRQIPPARVQRRNDSEIIITFTPSQVLEGLDAQGKLQFSIDEGLKGKSDWQALDLTFIRVPSIRKLTPSPGAPAGAPCRLEGSNFYLIEDAAADAASPASKINFVTNGGVDSADAPCAGPRGTILIHLVDYLSEWIVIRPPAAP